MTCELPGHGYWFVGRPGLDARGEAGFRTDRCPRSWAADPFIRVVSDASYWVDRNAGLIALGTNPVAALFDAVGLFGSERGKARDEMQRVKALRNRPKPRTGGKRRRFVIEDFDDE